MRSRMKAVHRRSATGRSRRRSALFAVGLCALVMIGQTGCAATGSDPQAVADLSTSPVASATTGAGQAGVTSVSPAGLTLNVTNNSSHDLLWVDSPETEPVNKAKNPLNHGDSDQLRFGLTTQDDTVYGIPQWGVAGTNFSVSAFFQVGADGNLASCGGQERGLPVAISVCEIGTGPDPVAQLTIVDA